MVGDGCNRGTIEFARPREGRLIWSFIANKANEAANEDEVIGSGQSELRFPGKGLGSTRSDFQKDERSGQQRKVGPHCRWEREKLREEKLPLT